MLNKSLAQEIKQNVKFSLASVELSHVYTDFMLSRQASQATRSTLEWYGNMLNPFLKFAAENGVSTPDDITAQIVRMFIVSLEGKASSTVHGHSRAIRTFLKFLFAESHMAREVKFAMPKLEQKQLRCLSADEVSIVLKAANVRDRALIALLVDTGIRREEACLLDWEHLNFNNGTIIIKRGKGGKPRVVACGAKTRRLLLAWRRECGRDSGAMFTSLNERIKGDGIRHVCMRLSKKTGITFSPHDLRRTHAILSLRNGNDLATLQKGLGHSSIEMTAHYLTYMDADLIQAAATTSPIDGLSK